MIDQIKELLNDLYELDVTKQNQYSVLEKFNFVYDGIPLEIGIKSLPQRQGLEPDRGFQGYYINFFLDLNKEHNIFTIELISRDVHPVVGKGHQIFNSKDKEAILSSIDLPKFVSFLSDEVDKLAERTKQHNSKKETAQDIANQILNLRKVATTENSSLHKGL